MIKVLIIILVFLFYWTFVYYRFHYSDFTPISVIVAGILLLVIGVRQFTIGNITLAEIKTVYLIGTLFLTLSYLLIAFAIKKHGLNKKVDITFVFLNKIGGKWLVYFFAALGFPSFLFIMAGTYYVIGQEHVYAWGMIFLAWAFSGIKLFKYTIS